MMETNRTRQLEATISRYRKALKRIAECKDAPDIDPTGDTEYGLHCGVEDCMASDRYEGANIGYAQGCEAALEWASNEAKHALENTEVSHEARYER